MADNKAAKPDNAKKPEEEKKDEKQPQVEELVSSDYPFFETTMTKRAYCRMRKTNS